MGKRMRLNRTDKGMGSEVKGERRLEETLILKRKIYLKIFKIRGHKSWSSKRPYSVVLVDFLTHGVWLYPSRAIPGVARDWWWSMVGAGAAGCP